MSKKSFVILALLYAAVSLVLTRLPLVNYLGYEFSVVISLLVAVVAGPAAIIQLKTTSSDSFPKNFFRIISAHLQLLAIPLAIITGNALFVKNCSLSEGLGFYLLIPCATVLFSVSLAAAYQSLVRHPLVWYVVSVVLLLLYTLYLGYCTPQIFSYNVLYGYFPGITYDEVIVITWRLVLFRILTVAVAGVFFLITLYLRQHSTFDESFVLKVKRLFTIRFSSLQEIGILVGVILLLVSFLCRTMLGFESSSSSIQNSLGKQFTSEHFTIYYSSESFSDDEIRWVAVEHEFRLSQVETALQQKMHGKIESYIYPDERMKRYFIGTGNTNIAKPWRKEIHLNQQSWKAVVKHELVHVVAGEFGMPVIRAHYHVGLVEGLAEAIDKNFGVHTLDEYAAAVQQFGIISSSAELITPYGFATHASSISYVFMGSFCQYLIRQYGIAQFKQLYGGASVESVYGVSYGPLVEQWQRQLHRIQVRESWREHIGYYFKRPSIFAKECPRAIAKLNEEGWNDLREKATEEAMGRFSQSLQRSWNSEAFSGLCRASYRAMQYDTLISLIDRIQEDTLHRKGILDVLLMYGDAQWFYQNTAKADSIFRYIVSLHLSDNQQLQALLRSHIVHNHRLQDLLFPYVSGRLTGEESIQFLDSLQLIEFSPVLAFFQALEHVRSGNYRDVIDDFEQRKIAYDDSILTANKELILAESYFRIKDLHSARRSLVLAHALFTEGAIKIEIQDALERCDWFETNGNRYVK